MFDRLLEWLESHMIVAGVLVAFIVSLLRTWNDKTSLTHKIGESLLCSFLTSGMYYLINHLYACPETLSVTIGCFIGYLGTEQIKELLLKRILKREEQNANIGKRN